MSILIIIADYALKIILFLVTCFTYGIFFLMFILAFIAVLEAFVGEKKE